MSSCQSRLNSSEKVVIQELVERLSKCLQSLRKRAFAWNLMKSNERERGAPRVAGNPLNIVETSKCPPRLQPHRLPINFYFDGRAYEQRYDGIESSMARVGSIVAPLHFVPPSFSLLLRSKLIYLHFIMQSRHACTTGDLCRRYFNVKTCRG